MQSMTADMPCHCLSFSLCHFDSVQGPFGQKRHEGGMLTIIITRLQLFWEGHMGVGTPTPQTSPLLLLVGRLLLVHQPLGAGCTCLQCVSNCRHRSVLWPGKRWQRPIEEIWRVIMPGLSVPDDGNMLRQQLQVTAQASRNGR